MFFQLPQFGWALALPALLAGSYVLAQQRRRRFALRYASVALARGARGGRGWRRHAPPLLFLTCLCGLVLGLMRPAVMVRVPSDEGVVIVMLDVSASMWATDLLPSRMEAAKAAAQLFVDELPPKMRVGVVSFSEASYLNEPPTTDRERIHTAIARLEPRTGTAIGNGLLTSLDALYGAMGAELPVVPRGTYASAVIVLLTDGENTDGTPPLEVVGQAVERGIRVYTIGIGSTQPLDVRQGQSTIRASLDEDTLKQIAAQTGARYYNASTDQGLQAVYQNLTTQLVTRNQPQEISFVFVGAALLLGMTALLGSLVWSTRLP